MSVVLVLIITDSNKFVEMKKVTRKLVSHWFEQFIIGKKIATLCKKKKEKL